MADKQRTLNLRFKKFRKEANKKADGLQRKMLKKYGTVLTEFHVYFDYWRRE